MRQTSQNLAMTPQLGTRVAIAILAGHHLVQNRLLNERGYVTGNLVVSGALVALGRASGLGWKEMGLHPDGLRSGLRIGTWAVAGSAAGALIAHIHPGARALLHDERARPAKTRSPWKRALVRFPLGTALFEEVAFRGVLTALLRRSRPARTAELASAGLFALWHLIPTARALSGNPVGRELPPARRALAIVGGSVGAGGFGLAFSAMRDAGGSLLAPWLAHSGVNTFSYLAGVAAWRRRAG